MEHRGYNNVVSSNANSVASKYKFNNKELNEELGLNMYDFGARMLDPALGRWFSIDPLAENSLDLNPYHFVANNPLIFVDPDGMDWFYYKKEGEEEASWNWQDGSEYEHSYTYTDDDGNEQTESITLQGVKAVVVFDGSTDEKLGADGKMTGEGANPANVTVYGPGGASDVQTYRGISTTSDPSKYSMIAEGDYEGRYQDMGSSPFGTAGAKKRGYPTALTYRIYDSNGNSNLSIEGGGKNKLTGLDYISEVFLHRTNWAGKATGGVSQGCLIIDGRQWRKVEKQLGKLNSFLIQVRRNPSKKSNNNISTVTTKPKPN